MTDPASATRAARLETPVVAGPVRAGVTEAQRIRTRNTSRVQIGVAIACLLVAALLALLELLPDVSFSNLPMSIASLVLLAIWMFQRASRGRRALRT